MRISDWSSDVCSSDLQVEPAILKQPRLIAKSIETQGPDAQFGDLLLQFGEEQLHHRSTHRVGRAAPREDRLPAIERVQTLQHDLCLAQRMVDRVALAPLSWEERRVGEGGDRPGRHRGAPNDKK